jgi:hypothetical protein
MSDKALTMNVLSLEAGETLTDEEIEAILANHPDGVVSSVTVPVEQLDHATLETMYQQDMPGARLWLVGHRTEWVKTHHPEFLQ